MKSKFFYPEGFKILIPDSFFCLYRCNTCYFNIIKYDSYYTIVADGCTERGCFCKEYPKDEELCFENWMLSKHIIYNDFPIFVNNCINGYRNVIYVRHIQQTIDKDFSIKQSQSLEHTRIALQNGIILGCDLHRLLTRKSRFTRKNKFTEDELLVFSAYLRSHRLHSAATVSIRQNEKQKINSVKKIFDYLRAQAKNINRSLLNQTIQQFDLEYEKYINRF